MNAANIRSLYSILTARTDEINSRRMFDRNTIALSDVDGTLVRGSLVLQHATLLHNQGVINLGDLPDKWARDKKDEAVITELAIAYQNAVTGMHVSDLGVDDFLDSVCNNSESFYSPLQRLEKQRSRGSDVLLISGSPDYLVDNFAKRYGFRSKASRYHTNSRGVLTGDLTGMFNATAKRGYVKSLNLAKYSNVLGFGDTASDVPLFEVANYSVLVAPNDETRNTVGLSVNEIVED